MVNKVATRPPVRWRMLLTKGAVWLSSEIMLGMIGMDTMADYSEFLMHSRVSGHVGDAIAAITLLM